MNPGLKMRSLITLFFLISTSSFLQTLSLDLNFGDAHLRKVCPPGLHGHVFASSVPTGELKVHFQKVSDQSTPEECTASCCEDSTCNEAFIYEKNQSLTCYKVTCSDISHCLPKKDEKGNSTHVILVRSGEDKTWSELLGLKDSPARSLVCEVGLDLENCHENEECVPMNAKSRNGKCTCKKGFAFDEQERCVQSEDTKKASTKTPEPRQITVQISSKNITLPVNSASLTAFALPEAPAGEKYEYEWVLISNQTSGAMENGNGQTLTVSNLVVGTYTFKVTVKGDSAIGEARGNITVFPEKRINLPPKAILRPPNQTITLPIDSAIIDGSESTDEFPEKLTFRWEKVAGPLQYPGLPSSEQQQILKLTNLIIGNYTIKLTVTDPDGLSDSSSSNLTVLPQKDYPPTANAGEDIIIYLPQNQVVLNGNRSTDDHGIVSWEWTRDPSDTDLAADIQDVRTAHPKISNLVKGVYMFGLKVTDIKGQTNEDKVTVYVRDPISVPPKANAGKDQEVSLPVTQITLDGSLSKDAKNIVSYNWTQVSGPSASNILNASSKASNVTNITKGVYVYKLTVGDNAGNQDEDSVSVTVNQDTNSPPVANAGEDLTLHLPLSVISLNGSLSKDDLRISRWEWSREDNSLAAGKIIGNSSFEPVLYITNVVPGQYIFQLQVWDDQGKSSKDSVSINVEESPHQKEILQLILNENLGSLTSKLLDRILERIKLSIVKGDDDTTMAIHLVDLFPQIDSNFAVIHFSMKKKDKNGQEVVMKGVDVLKTLKTKLRTDPDTLELKVVDLDTLVCQNKCSGHGKCHQASRTCVCDPFWIENFVRRQLMDGKRNCEWSIIYVGIFLSILTTVIVCGLVFVMCKKRPLPNKTSKRKYSRLGQREENMELQSPYTSSLMESESESDDEILFENGAVVGNGAASTLTNRSSSSVART